MATITEKKLAYLQGTKDAIKNAIIAKGQSVTDTDTFRSYADKIAAISGGGSADLVYVTFMSHDGAKELHKRAVVKGNTCMCPVTGAIQEIDVPTRDSTELYRYIFGGWSTTPNGALNESALEAITADKTVYAYFTAVTRFYTVNFYNGDTLCSTQQVAYGMSATPPEVEKEGYRLDGWSADYTNITGDTDCYAVWTEKLKFANATWSEIAEISEAGEAESYFKVGDTKAVACGDETIVVTVAGFNHDTLTDGSGKAGMSIVCTTIPTTKSRWGNGSQKNYVNSYAYTAKNNLLANLPTELQAVIKPVDKAYDTTVNQGTSPTTATVSESLWLLSAAELGFTWASGYTTNNLTKLGTRYALFPENTDFNATTYGSTKLNVIYSNGEHATYWTRNVYRNGAYNAVVVFYNAQQKTSVGRYLNYWQDTEAYGLCFGFCV